MATEYGQRVWIRPRQDLNEELLRLRSPQVFAAVRDAAWEAAYQRWFSMGGLIRPIHTLRGLYGVDSKFWEGRDASE